MPSKSTSLWSRLLKVGTPFFVAGPRRRAYGGLAALVILLLAVNGLNVVNSYVGRDFMNSLGERDLPRFYFFAGVLAVVFAASTAAQVLSTFVQQRLALLWRKWQTQTLVGRYLAGRAYHTLNARDDIDNPDQRISEDVRTFTDATLGFMVLLFNALLTLAAFAGVLWSIRPSLFLAAAAYAAMGSVGTILLGRPLVRLNYLQLMKEADFRFALVRVREHARSVAQLGGESDEAARLDGRLAALVSNFRTIIAVSRNLGFFTTMYNFLPQIIPVLLTAPLYIRGEVQLGVVTQAMMAFAQVLGGFSLIVTQFQALSAYAAVLGRLGSLWEATAPPEPAAMPEPKTPERAPEAPTPPPASAVVTGRAEKCCVAYNRLTLRTPEGRLLVRALELEIREGNRVLVTGPSGSGKTTLLLATAGLWKSGEGRVLRPDDRVMFLPKTPYAAPGRLRDLLRYGAQRDIPDNRIREALREVGLAELADRSGGLDAEQNWTEVLSKGEQELVAFARLLAVSPKFAFLDDPAATLDAAGLTRVYEALQRSRITYVSVGGHVDLRKYHDQVLELHGDGTWHVGPAKSPSAA
jgi:putative ATP-binding cassette transporter